MCEDKKRDAEASKKKILKSAKVIFSEKGYDKTTLEEIAKASGLARTTPSYFFKNKQNLYKQVIDILIKDEKEYVNQLHPEKELTYDSLKRLLSLHMDYTFRYPYLAKIMIWESLNKDRHPWMYEYFPDMITWSHEYLKEAQEQGLIRQDIDTYSLWLDAMGMTWLPILTADTFFSSINKDVFSEEYIEERKEHVKKIIFDGICNNPQK